MNKKHYKIFQYGEEQFIVGMLLTVFALLVMTETYPDGWLVWIGLMILGMAIASRSRWKDDKKEKWRWI